MLRDQLPAVAHSSHSRQDSCWSATGCRMRCARAFVPSVQKRGSPRGRLELLAVLLSLAGSFHGAGAVVAVFFSKLKHFAPFALAGDGPPNETSGSASLARHCRAWRIASFNCQHVDLGHTVDDVLRHFPDHQVVALQATGEHLRAQLPLGESHTLRRTAWGWVCHIPWSAGAFANQSCGLALAFSHRAVRRGGIQMIKLPSPELGISGRAAAIRVRRRQEYDFCIFSLCWPTGVRQNESGFRSLASWIGTVLQDLPGRCLPILCGDFNAKFTYDASRGSVGPCGEQVASPSWLSRIWLDVADRFQLVAANTFAPAGSGPT